MDKNERNNKRGVVYCVVAGLVTCAGRRDGCWGIETANGNFEGKKEEHWTNAEQRNRNLAIGELKHWVR